MTISVRAPTSADADRIAGLLDQLGYPATPAEVVHRLERLESFPHATVLVAERGGHVVGLVTGHVFPSIHATPIVAWLTTLVIDSAAHGAGIGRTLAAAVEGWARQQGAVRISVTSGNQRADAHAFYEHIGYERTGVRLTKQLA